MACKRRISVRRIVFFVAIYASVAFGVGSFVVAKMVTREAMTKETVVQEVGCWNNRYVYAEW